MKDHAQKGDKQKLPSQLPHLFNCTLLWFLILLSCALLIPFRISLFINSMLCWCNVLCVVCSAFVWASQLKSHYLCPEIGNNSDFFSWWWWWWWRWWWLILFNVSHFIFHFICLFLPVVQTRHNFNSSQCTCEGKYSFLNLFLVVGLLFFSNVASRCIVKCESIVNKWEKKPGF